MSTAPLRRLTVPDDCRLHSFSDEHQECCSVAAGWFTSAAAQLISWPDVEQLAELLPPGGLGQQQQQLCCLSTAGFRQCEQRAAAMAAALSGALLPPVADTDQASGQAQQVFAPAEIMALCAAVLLEAAQCLALCEHIRHGDQSPSADGDGGGCYGLSAGYVLASVAAALARQGSDHSTEQAAVSQLWRLATACEGGLSMVPTAMPPSSPGMMASPRRPAFGSPAGRQAGGDGPGGGGQTWPERCPAAAGHSIDLLLRLAALDRDGPRAAERAAAAAAGALLMNDLVRAVRAIDLAARCEQPVAGFGGRAWPGSADWMGRLVGARLDLDDGVDGWLGEAEHMLAQQQQHQGGQQNELAELEGERPAARECVRLLRAVRHAIAVAAAGLDG